MSKVTDDALAAVESLLQTMKTLRSPEGCDWDRQQSPKTLKKHILEEAYEVIEAIDRGDPEEICEELGDLLMQVVFQAQIFQEQGAFGMAEIALSIDSKLKRRHPHIFVSADQTNREFDWERSKREERAQKGLSHHLGRRIPQALPALMRAAKLASSLERETKQTVLPLAVTRKVTGYLAELGNSSITQEQSERQIGNILYHMTVLARSLNIDAEEALRLAVDRRINEHDVELDNRSV